MVNHIPTNVCGTARKMNCIILNTKNVMIALTGK